jgi:hypothetical protein
LTPIVRGAEVPDVIQADVTNGPIAEDGTRGASTIVDTPHSLSVATRGDGEYYWANQWPHMVNSSLTGIRVINWPAK